MTLTQRKTITRQRRRRPAKTKSNCWPTHNLSWLSGSMSLPELLVLLCCCLIFMPQNSYGYNIDLPSYVRHARHASSMFGYSLAFFKGSNGYPPYHALLVGAPKLNASLNGSPLVENGAVFRCGMHDDDCEFVKFDSLDGDIINEEGDPISRKSHQWFGATVTTSRDSDVIVACAPRFIFHTMKPRREIRYDPVGTCFVSRNFSNFHEVSPCRTSAFGYHRQGSCQAGFSAAVSKDGSRFFVGAPGSWYWQGQVYSIWPDATFPFMPDAYTPFGTGGRGFVFDITRPENQVFSTTEGSKYDDDSYLGYSMITGDFNGDQVDDVAIGMPRASKLVGKIVVSRWNMVNMFNITGRQIGEYFGYALATSDVDGDGLDDLIIGAPMFSEPGNPEGNYDVGRVYILLQKATAGPERWITEHIRDGYNSKSRFGTALTTLGDINRDGYGDFAVGAPYDGLYSRGIVYIFHGSRNGPLLKPSQIIKAEDIVESVGYPRTFGFSLAGGVDIDGNTYPDLAVGAYGSGQVYIFKSRPVAAVTATTTFSNANKLINLEEKTCQTLRSRKYVACTNINTCWSYTGEYLPGSLEFDVSWVLDTKKPKNPRMFFLHDEDRNVRNQSISLTHGKNYCLTKKVYVVDNIQDKLTPLEVETRYNLRSAYAYAPQRRKREALEPVIDQNRETVPTDVINIKNNCGEKNICVPDLRLEIKTLDKYVLGSQEPLKIQVIVSNMKQDAYEAAFYMVVPKDLDYINKQEIGDKSDTPITCTAPSEANNYTLKCDLGNPLQSKNIAKFNVVLIPSHKKGMAPSYDFFMEVNSTNVEPGDSYFDNVIRKSIGIWVQTDLSIVGRSLPDSENYNASNYKKVEDAKKEEDLGPQVVHLYNIHNQGPSVIDELVVYLHYPFKTVGGDLLMYLTSQPQTAGSIQCDFHYNANVNNLKLDQTLERKKFLEQVGAVVRPGNSTDSTSVRENTKGGGGAVVHFSNKSHKLSEEEIRRLKAEDEIDSSGDASFIHSQRASSAADGAASGSSSAFSYAASGPTAVVETRNSTVYYDQNGHPRVVESSTQYTTSLNSLPVQYTAEQQQAASNYQQGGRGQATNYQQSGSIGGNLGQSGKYQQSASNYQQTTDTAGHGPANGYHMANQQQQFKSTDNYGAHNARSHIEIPTTEVEHAHQQNYVNAPNSEHYRLQPINIQQQQQQLHYPINYGPQIAKSGSGFQVGAFDLGSDHIQTANVDNELRRRGSYPNQPHNEPRQYRSSASSSFGRNPPYYGLENEDDYYEEHNGQRSGNQQRRVRRETLAVETTVQPDAAPEPLQVDIACSAANCEAVRCVAKNLGKDDEVWVALRSRLVAHTMAKLSSDMPIKVSTMAVSYVTRLPYIGKPKDDIKRSHEVFYKAIPEVAPVPDVVPLWVVVLAACAGALILLLLIFLLYKCGFFKRNRPTDHSMERQPLRNGYHGDEHL